MSNKTIDDWLNQLPTAYAHLARIRRRTHPHDIHTRNLAGIPDDFSDIHHALNWAFDWQATPEGWDWWEKVGQAALAPTFPPVTIPTTTEVRVIQAHTIPESERHTIPGYHNIDWTHELLADCPDIGRWPLTGWHKTNAEKATDAAMLELGWCRAPGPSDGPAPDPLFGPFYYDLGKRITAFCIDVSGKGTIWIETILAPASDLEAAKRMAAVECAAAWDYEDVEDIHVLGLIEDDVNVLFWQDVDE